MNTLHKMSYLKRGIALCKKTNKSPLEQKAATAFKRITIGALVLNVLCMIAFIIIISTVLFSMGSDVKRYGTVEGSQVRYVQNTMQYKTLAELHLDEYSLQDGDRVIIYFDTVTDEITEAYPQTYIENLQNTQAGIIVGSMVLWIFLLIAYILFCRFTSYGNAWTQYNKIIHNQSTKTASPVPLGKQILLYVICFAIAIILCWPQVISLLNHWGRLSEIQEQSNRFHNGIEAGNAASEMIDDLEQIQEEIKNSDTDSDTNPGIEGVNDAMDRINEILNQQ